MKITGVHGRGRFKKRGTPSRKKKPESEGVQGSQPDGPKEGGDMRGEGRKAAARSDCWKLDSGSSGEMATCSAAWICNFLPTTVSYITVVLTVAA